MPPTHRKLRRKELKQPDEFLTFVENAQAFLTENLNRVIISAAVVLAVGAIAFGLYSYERHVDHEAAASFYAAFNALNSKDYATAEKGFEKLAEEDSDRTVGKLARFYLASAYIGQNNLQKAEGQLVAFVSEDHDPTFSSMAMADLGAVYEKKGDYQKAASAYAQSASVAGPEQIRAQLGNARMLAKLGQHDMAIKAYQNFLQEHPFVQQRQEAMEALANLGGAPPAQARALSGLGMPQGAVP